MKNTGYKDRNGTPIHVGDLLKWVQNDEFYKSGSKRGQLKQKGAEFIAGRAIEVDVKGYDYWAKPDGAKDEKNFSQLPPGLNFPNMLQYIEIVPE